MSTEEVLSKVHESDDDEMVYDEDYHKSDLESVRTDSGDDSSDNDDGHEDRPRDQMNRERVVGRAGDVQTAANNLVLK